MTQLSYDVIALFVFKEVNEFHYIGVVKRIEKNDLRHEPIQDDLIHLTLPQYSNCPSLLSLNVLTHANLSILALTNLHANLVSVQEFAL